MRSLVWFFMGTVFGALLILGILWGLTDAWARHGVHIQARADDIQLASELVSNLRSQAGDEIQRALSDIQGEVAQEVSRRMTGTMKQAGITVYGVEITLPEEATQRMEQTLGDLISEELSRSFSSWPWEDVVDHWASYAEGLVEETMASGGSHLILVDLGPYKSLPVHIKLETPSP